MAAVLDRDERRIAAARRELHSRRTGRAGVGTCPGCGELVVLVVYTPKNRFEPAARPQHRRTRRRGPVEGDAPRLVFDYPAAARTNTYANYASTNAYQVARLLPDPDDAESLLPPLADHEVRLCLHIARHSECEPYLTAPKN